MKSVKRGEEMANDAEVRRIILSDVIITNSIHDAILVHSYFLCSAKR